MPEIAFQIVDDRGVIEAIRFVADQAADMQPFFAAMRGPWYASRREMYRTMGRSTRTPWVQYRDTPEGLRYVYYKASRLGKPAAAIQDTVLDWPGKERLRRAVEGDSSEGRYTARRDGAEIMVDVEYATNHDRGEGVAPEYAWPKVGGVFLAYNNPRRRLTSLAGGFTRDFARGFAEHIGGGKAAASGVSTEELRRQMTRALARQSR